MINCYPPIATPYGSSGSEYRVHPTGPPEVPDGPWSLAIEVGQLKFLRERRPATSFH